MEIGVQVSKSGRRLVEPGPETETSADVLPNTQTTQFDESTPLSQLAWALECNKLAVNNINSQIMLQITSALRRVVRTMILYTIFYRFCKGGCSAYLLEPSDLQAAACSVSAIVAVPANKLFAFGGDTSWPNASVAYAAQARRWLTRALHAEIEEGLMTERQAIALATRLMSKNQQECFDVEGTRAAIRHAVEAGEYDE